MIPSRWTSSEEIAAVVKQCLEEGKSVEIDGLGTFRADSQKGFRFTAGILPKVFLAYVQEDAASAERLFDGFCAHGFAPWLDRRKLLPGQNWPRSIEDAIETSDFFVACFSRNSVSKAGGFQAEIRYALDCARRVPLDEIFIIPVRLDECPVPARIRKELQYIDLFPDWSRGVRRIAAMLNRKARKTARTKEHAQPESSGGDIQNRSKCLFSNTPGCAHRPREHAVRFVVADESFGP